MDVVLAQEDLWVYEALLRVVKSVNEAATSPTNASVKRIEALEIGRDSRTAWKQSRKHPCFAAGRTGGRAGMPPTGPECRQRARNASRRMPGMDPGAGSTGQADRDLFTDRYVDEKGQPLAVEAEYPYVKHPYAEFKMMPIHMSLLMDQRSLPKLLVECANSNMPIEVRRIRILKTPFEPFDLDSQTAGPRLERHGSDGPMPGGCGPMAVCHAPERCRTAAWVVRERAMRGGRSRRGV